MKRLGWSSAAILIIASSVVLAEEKTPPQIPKDVLNKLIANDRLPEVRLPRTGQDPVPTPPSASVTNQPQADNGSKDTGKPDKNRILPPIPSKVIEMLLAKGLTAHPRVLAPKGLLKEKLTGKPAGTGKPEGVGKPDGTGKPPK